jgi:hypothetical protein
VGLHQTKIVLLHKGNSQHEMKRQPTEWEEVFANLVAYKGLIMFKIHKELIIQLQQK